MPDNMHIRQATSEDSEEVSRILTEAAQWLERSGMPLWKEGELTLERVAADVAAGLYFIAECDGETAGTVRFQLEDAMFWPDDPRANAAYVHRLAVRRRYAGTGLSTVILSWAVERTRGLGRNFLRLDCDASRPRLRQIYESFGFVHHSDRQVGSYFVSRYQLDVTKPRT